MQCGVLTSMILTCCICQRQQSDKLSEWTTHVAPSPTGDVQQASVMRVKFDAQLILPNRLTNVSSVDYLANLQYLDVSHNQIDSVNGKSEATAKRNSY